MKRFSAKKFVMILLIAAVAIAAFGWIVMSLWNAILPAVIAGVKPISFLQALGILALSKILFGGFGKGGGAFRQKRMEWRHAMKQKWEGMTPEEREKFKTEWKGRCASMKWGRAPWQQNNTAE